MAKLRRVEIEYRLRDAPEGSPPCRISMCEHEPSRVVITAPLRNPKDIANGWRAIAELRDNPNVFGWKQWTREGYHGNR